MARTTRRQFFQTSALVSGAFYIGGTKASGDVIGANERVRIAVIGLNGRGKAHLAGFGKLKNVEIASVVDPDENVLNRCLSKVQSKENGKNCRGHKDIRSVLEDKNIDAISIATPNHWHSLMTIWGAQAGKHVYVEKPMSHDITEGRVAVEAQKKYGVVVQHGTQRRSDAGIAALHEALKSGKLPRLKIAYGYCCKPRDGIGFKTPGDPPSNLDWNLWKGPAVIDQYHDNLVHYNWHWFWNYGNGDIGNQGVHQMDIARWMIPGAVWPQKVFCVGGRFGYKDQAQTANTQLAIFDYGESLLVFDVRGLSGKSNMGVSNHVYFDKNAKQKTTKSHGIKHIKDPLADRGKVDIFENFIQAVRNRKENHLDAHVYEGHVSSGLCHLANLSYRLGEKSGFSKKNKDFGGNKKAYEYFERMQEHLKENGLTLEGTDYIVGRTLNFDSKTESITGDDEANKMLSRTYRPPYMVPNKV